MCVLAVLSQTMHDAPVLERQFVKRIDPTKMYLPWLVPEDNGTLSHKASQSLLVMVTIANQFGAIAL